MSKTVSRRGWLLHCLQASVALTLAVLLYPVVRFLRPRKSTRSARLRWWPPIAWTNSSRMPKGTGPRPSTLAASRLADSRGRRAAGVQCSLHPCAMHGRVSARGTRYILQLPQRHLQPNGRNIAGPRPGRWKSTKRSKAPGNPARRRSSSPTTHDGSPNDERGKTASSGVIPALKAFFYERLGLDVARRWPPKSRVPVHRTSLFYFLGGMALFLFGIQVATGILLRSTIPPLRPTRRSRSVRGIVTEVDFGWLFRSIHSWSRQPPDRRAVSAHPHDLHHAGVSAAAKSPG